MARRSAVLAAFELVVALSTAIGGPAHYLPAQGYTNWPIPEAHGVVSAEAHRVMSCNQLLAAGGARCVRSCDQMRSS